MTCLERWAVALAFCIACNRPTAGDAGADAAGVLCGSSLVCNPLDNSGCDPGQECVANGLPPHGTCTAAGTLTLGAPCDPVMGMVCGAQLICQDGFCRRLCCQQDTTACLGADLAPGSACVVLNSTSGLGACNKQCQWSPPSMGCAATETCAPVSADGTSLCHPAGALTEYAPCVPSPAHAGDCGPGLYCAQTNTTPPTDRCLAICDMNHSAGWPANHGWVPLESAQFPATFGVCLELCDAGSTTCPMESQCVPMGPHYACFR